jgi:hypothetical protein
VQDVYVFDEDLLGTLLEKNTAKLNEVYLAIAYLKMRGVNTKCFEDALMIDRGIAAETPQQYINESLLQEITSKCLFKSNVIKFFVSTLYIINEHTIDYLTNHLDKLPSNKKIVILDGTSSVTVYEKLLGSRLHVTDITNVALKGKIMQHPGLSCSKYGLTKYREKILKMVGDQLVLTFKGEKHKFPNPVELHYGGARGSNELMGKDFCVVGKLTYPPNYYKFLSKILGLDSSDFTMKTQYASYKGLSFTYTTFNDPMLQILHFEQVEGDIVQAVHRGRPIRTYCTVTLFTDFPIGQANYIY